MKLFMLLSIYSLSNVYGGQCPATWGDRYYHDRVVIAINAAANCNAGMDIALKCAMGNSTDPIMYDAAEKKCTKNISNKRSEIRLLDELLVRCENKYAEAEGTLYDSMKASCRAKAAQFIAELNSPFEE